ncbi:hypothetical protein KI387_006760, partial [Taxus chinensis]
MCAAVPGFLSIDCGAKTNHRDAYNIEWVTDDNYIDVGQKADINDSTVPVYQQTIRVFRQPLNKSCYQLPITPNVPHLFRIWFYKGNYTGLEELPSFMYSIETTDMLSLRTIKLQSPQNTISGERILVTSGEVLYICLIRASEIDDPFITAMELRTLRQGMYHQAQPGAMLSLEARYDTGGKSIIRHPQDQFDRMWYPFNIQGLENVELQEAISTNNTEDLPPTAVMQTAVAAVNHNSITFNLNGLSNSLLLLYFAEIQTLNVSETRNFNILENNIIRLGSISLVRNFSAIEMAFFSEERPLFLFSLYKPLNSSAGRGPMINAFEYYQLTPTQPPTSSEDDHSLVYVPNPSKSRAFTLDDLMTATGNFSYKIGQGGFGSVFWGTSSEGIQIAVKVLSLFSKQGVSEFLNEIDLLSRVHHKKLVSLLGYCNESRELMLVYEYMSGGSLKDHLYGPMAGKYPNLDWKTRLRIVLDAAQGLEYLHVNCTPKIIHRDIKTANILLDDHLNGKLADFGLSRVTMDGDASHVTTAVKGTAGYLDPEYLNTQMLTDKSDVYSFGAVLLEIVCGRPPIDIRLSDNKISLVKWVTPFMEMDEDPGKIAEIVDKRLGNDYSIKSITRVAKLALRCVGGEPSSRPSVSRVVAELKEAMQYHEASVDLSEEIDIDYGDQQSSLGF